MLSQKRLKEILRYDENTGEFYWKEPPSTRILAGTKAGTIKDGYIRISVARKLWYAHRLVFLYLFGKLPTGVVDHIDHNRLNNRPNNLRDVDQVINQRNRKGIQTNNTSGIQGVSYDIQRGKWAAYSHVKNKKIFLGYHKKKEDACLSREYWTNALHTSY